MASIKKIFEMSNEYIKLLFLYFLMSKLVSNTSTGNDIRMIAIIIIIYFIVNSDNEYIKNIKEKIFNYCSDDEKKDLDKEHERKHHTFRHTELNEDNEDIVKDNFEDDIKDIKPKNIRENLVKKNKITFDIDKKNKNNKKFNLCEKYTDLASNPYPTSIGEINTDYIKDPNNHLFELRITPSILTTPIFNLKNIDNIPFFWNFRISNLSNKSITNLIMLKDVSNWVESSTISNEDLPDGMYPIYITIKKDKDIATFEYLKIFINSDNCIKTAFVQKGLDYIKTEIYINELLSKDLMKDLLKGKAFHSYNLSKNSGVLDFLESILSLILLPSSLIGKVVTLDIKHYIENKETFATMFGDSTFDFNCLNTSI
jgi:hypothetical protein